MSFLNIIDAIVGVDLSTGPIMTWAMWLLHGYCPGTWSLGEELLLTLYCNGHLTLLSCCDKASKHTVTTLPLPLLLLILFY